MNIAVFSSYVICPGPYETELEIMQDHCDAGDQVVHLVCDAQISACEANREHDCGTCIYCIGKRMYGRSLISKNIQTRTFLQLPKTDQQELQTIRKEFVTVEELKQYSIDNFDIGYAIASSLISQLRDPSPDLRQYSSLVKRLLISTLMVYRSFQRYLDQHHTDRVYIFNGRLAIERAALRACESRNVNYVTHEIGHNIHFYALYPNTLPHSLTYTESAIRQAWQNAEDDRRREEIAANFFIDRTKGIEQNWYSFTKTQIEGLLPHGWEHNQKNIIIFTSSEDEIAAIGDEYQNPIYASQLEGITSIAASLEHAGGIHLYVRMHPNLKGIKNADVENMLHFRSPNVTIIAPDSLVSTYTLLRHADVIVTFGSTVGIEAVYWGKPSILAGQAFYKNLGGTYNAFSHDEVIRLLVQDALPPKAKEPALMYGYYMNTYGIKYKYYETEAFFKGKFKGHALISTPPLKYFLPSLPIRGLRALKRLAKKGLNHYSISGMRGMLTFLWALCIQRMPWYAAGLFEKARRYCPVCQWQGRNFLPYIAGGYVTLNALCPVCHSHARHRGHRIYYEKILQMHDKAGKLLYFAPEEGILPYLKANPNLEMITTDYGDIAGTDYQFNIMDIDVADNAFDLIICHRVIEHVPNDRKALAELYRILKPGGVLILSAQIASNLFETIEFGSPNPLLDNRYFEYGMDFTQRFPDKFEVEKLRFSEMFSKKEMKAMSLGEDFLFICSKRQ